MPDKRNKKNLYRQLCAKAPDIPLFMQADWLDIVCTEGSSWEVALVFKNDNKTNTENDIIAALTYNIRRKYLFFTSISEPHMTPFCGIWLKDKNLSDEEKTVLAQALLAQLPKATRISLRFHFSFSPTPAFFSNTFKYETKQTFILDNLQDTAAIFRQMNDNLKREIKKAAAYYTITTSNDVSVFLKLQNEIYRRQGIKNPTPDSIWYKIEDFLSKNHMRTLYFASTTEGGIDAAIYIVWDKTTAYYLASGATEGGRKNNAVALLLWQAIQDAATRVSVFDFEGSSIPSVAFFFKRFGGERKEYVMMSKNIPISFYKLSARHT